MRKINGGVYPTMITPYKNGEIDLDKTRELVEWYITRGCSGIFAVCQSSEMAYLSLRERIKLAETVVEQVDGRINVVASGHCGNSIAEQVEEINEISKTGIDAFVLVSNRFDFYNDGDDVWIENAERLLDQANQDIALGIYECPNPYKRLLSPRLIEWCKGNSRFKFIKDTCCDPELLEERGRALAGTNCLLFNANAQTLLHSLKSGAAGYSGIMANFHPDLLVWLCQNFAAQPQKAGILSDILSMAAFTEGPAYPCTAKYYLGFEGIEMECSARSSDEKRLTPYQKLVVRQMYELNTTLRAVLEEEACL